MRLLVAQNVLYCDLVREMEPCWQPSHHASLRLSSPLVLPLALVQMMLVLVLQRAPQGLAVLTDLGLLAAPSFLPCSPYDGPRAS